MQCSKLYFTTQEDNHNLVQFNSLELPTAVYSNVMRQKKICHTRGISGELLIFKLLAILTLHLYFF